MENRRLFEASIVDQTNTITQLHREVKQTTVTEHEKTRSILLRAAGEVNIRTSTSGTPKTNHPISQEEELEIHRRAEDRILRSLRIESMSERYSQIIEAHAATFEWIFKNPATEDPLWGDFTQWLQSGEGIYWINGKAGSGKSTLMRYIYDHQRTKTLLRMWSKEFPLTVASFFFWNSGTPDQKSQNGLLRCLLYELLSQNRHLIPVVLLDQWQDEYIDPIEWRQNFRWNTHVLRRALNALRDQNQICLCLFIDGLDEYEGDKDGTYAEIISFLVGLVRSPNIKICLSSRPWLVFEDAFRHSLSLKLQDLTFKDITRYVDDKINGHARMRELCHWDAERANNLTWEIVTKACGVFLWVKLVVKSLLDGFTNRDRISDLQRRLRELPADLESFYKHILINHIPPFYYEQSSQLLQYFMDRPRLNINYHAHRPPRAPICLLILSLAEEKDSMLFSYPPRQLLSSDDIQYRVNEMAARLKSRCGGLLEVSPNLGHIGYLHRTVRDFLKLPDTRLLLLSRTKSSFNPDEALFKAHILFFKYVMDYEDFFVGRRYSRYIDTALQHARQAMDVTGNSYARLLDELDSVVTHRWPQEIRSPKGVLLDIRALGAHWAEVVPFRNPTSTPNLDNFLALTLSFGLTEYVREKLNICGKEMLRNPGRPLLDYIAKPDLAVGSDMVFFLLQKGSDPNEIFSGCSPWQHMLELIGDLSGPLRRDPEHYVLDMAGTLKLFVNHGAHPNVLCRHIKNIKIREEDSEESPKYTILFSTPATIFSPNGMFPDAELVEAIKSRGGVEFWEAFQLKSTDWDDIEEEAMKLKPEVAQRFQSILGLQKQKRKPKKAD
jgi:hypothetical protein